jgi:hypothetical protein
VALIRVRPTAIAQFVSDIVQLDGRDGTGIGIQDEKIQRELTDSIEDGVGAPSAFEVQNLEKLDLGQHDVIRQALDQPLIQKTLAFTEQVPLGLQRPRTGEHAPGSEPLGYETEHSRCHQREEQPYIRSQMERFHPPIIA